VELIDGSTGHSGPVAHRHVLELKLVNKSTSAVLIQLSRATNAVRAVRTFHGRHGQFVIKNVPAASQLEPVPTLAHFQLNKTVAPVVEVGTMVRGQRGATVSATTAMLFFAVAVRDVELGTDFAGQTTKFKKLSATPNAAATTVSGLPGPRVVLPAAPVSWNVSSPTATIFQFDLIVKCVPMPLSSPTGPSGAPAVFPVEPAS